MADVIYDTVTSDLGNGRLRDADGDTIVDLAATANPLKEPIGIVSQSVPTATFTSGKPS